MILFIDLDGTLVGSRGVHERVWPALGELRRAGWRLAVCTGRPGRGIARDIARRLGPDGLHVFESGAVVMQGDAVVAHQAIEPAVVERLAAVGIARDVTLEAYTADGRYLARERNDIIARHEQLLGFAADVVPWPPQETIVRLQWVLPHEDWPAFKVESDGVIALHEGRSPRMPDVSFISMTTLGVSKATGVRVVLERLGLTRADAAMAGDNLNDLEAFDEVAHAFVPRDGAPAALARATHSIGSPDQGGVADCVPILLARPRA